MYVHIGGGAVLQAEDIIGVFDMDKATQSRRTRAFLLEAERSGRVESVGEEIPRSFVLTDAGGVPRVLLTRVTSATIKKRFSRKIKNNFAKK